MNFFQNTSFPQMTNIINSRQTLKKDIRTSPSQKLNLLPQVSNNNKRLCPYHSDKSYTSIPTKQVKPDPSSTTMKTLMVNGIPTYHQNLDLCLIQSQASVTFEQTYLRNPVLLDGFSQSLTPIKVDPIIKRENIEEVSMAPSVDLTKFMLEAVCQKLENDCYILEHRIKNAILMKEMLKSRMMKNNHEKLQEMLKKSSIKQETDRIITKLEGVCKKFPSISVKFHLYDS